MKHNPGFLKLVEEAKQRIKDCAIAEVKAKLDRGERFHFIDVREDNEWVTDHAKGAVHLGRGILERDIETGVLPYGCAIRSSQAPIAFGRKSRCKRKTAATAARPVPARRTPSSPNARRKSRSCQTASLVM